MWFAEMYNANILLLQLGYSVTTIGKQADDDNVSY